MTRSGALAARLLIAAFFSQVSLQAQTLTDTKPNLSGRWVLDGDLSEDPEEKLEQMDSMDPSGVRDGGGGRSRRGGRGFGAQMRTRIERAKDLLREASDSLAIVHQDPKLSIVQENGDLTVFYTDKRRQKRESQEIQTAWDGGRVVVERRLGGGVTVFETYDVRSAQRQMVVNKRLVISMIGQDHTIAVRTVYDLASAGQ